MELNISLNSLKNFQESKSSKTTSSSENMPGGKNMFNIFFKDSNAIKGDLNLDDKNKDITDEQISQLIQSLFINIQNINENNMSGLSKQDVNKAIEIFSGNYNSIKNYITDILGKNETLINNFELLDEKSKLEIYELIKDKLSNLDNSAKNSNYLPLNSEAKKEDNILNKILSKSSENKQNTDLDININNISNEENTKTKAYNELEISTLVNKSKILSTNSQDNKSKEIDKLEDIIGDNTAKFILSNNNLINDNVIKDKGIEPKNITKQYIAQDIVKTIKYLKDNNLEQITVKITPKELGEMDINIIKNQDDARLVITINKEDTFNMVNKNLNDIKSHLSDLNIKIKDVVIEMKNDNQNLFSGNLNQEFNRNNQNNNNNTNNNSKNRYKKGEPEEIQDIQQELNVNENIDILI